MTAPTRPEHAPRTTFEADSPHPDRSPVENRYARPGETFHFVKNGVGFLTKKDFMGSGQVSYKGQNVVITDDLLQAWPALSRYLGDDDAQVGRWGEVRFRPGSAPVDLPVWEYGSHEWEIARQKAMEVVKLTPDPVERARRYEAVQRVYGAPRSTQISAPATSAADQRRADEQRRRLDALGATHAIKNVEIPHAQHEPATPSDQQTGQPRA